MEDAQLFAKRKRELQEIQQRRSQQPRPIVETKDTPEPYSESEIMEGGEDTMQKIALPIVGILFVAVAAYFSFMFISLKQKEVENEARYQCAQSSRYQVVNEGRTTWYPAAELYTKCLEEKGVK